MEIKTEIKEEPFVLDFYSQNEEDIATKDPLRKFKREEAANDNYCEIDTNAEIEGGSVDSKFFSQNEGKLFSKGAVMEANERSTLNDVDSKIEFKEEQWWLESYSTNEPSVYNNIMDGRAEVFPSTQSLGLYKEEISSSESVLSSSKNFEKDTSINMGNNSTEYIASSKCKILQSISAGQIKADEMECKTSCLIQNSVTLQKNSQKHNSCKNCAERSVLVSDILNRDRCNVCEKTSPLPSYLELHKLVQKDKMSHKCNICEKSFPQLPNFKAHILTHEPKKPHKCHICSKSFTRMTHLKTHNLIHEGRKPHKCDTCGKSFTQLSHLLTHGLIHEGRKPHKCENCGKSFTRSSHLKMHKLIHDGTKPYKCDTCGKNFADLKRHRLIHEGGKPHKCDTCGKSFSQLSHLKIHKFIHEGRKPHECDICGKSFSDPSNLRKHKLTHEGRKPYKCDTCGKSFSETTHLKKHKLIHEGRKPHM